ncbi:MAG: hypothetical protein WCJ64_03440 [Rhodospirillaceae bacterium]
MCYLFYYVRIVNQTQMGIAMLTAIVVVLALTVSAPAYVRRGHRHFIAILSQDPYSYASLSYSLGNFPWWMMWSFIAIWPAAVPMRKW